MTQITLLAVDDKAKNLFLIEELVSEHLPECRVVTTQNPEEGLKIAAAQELGVAIFDVQMPGMDGIEMCLRLQADPASENVPVVLVTAHKSAHELRIRGLEAGADDFIYKPICTAEIVAKIKVMLRIKRVEDQLRVANARLAETVMQRTS
jgi:DNA-binding response OmpR family regulator